MIIANVALRGMNNYGPKLCGWLKERSPDIVTIQKIGLDKDFCKHKEELWKIGYNSKFRGDRAGNYPLGVAVLTCRKLPEPEEIPGELPCNGGRSRFLAVRIGNLSVCAIYVPPDSNKDGPTVDWLNCLREHICKEGYAQRKSLLCGDFNVPEVGASNGKPRWALDGLLRRKFDDLFRKAHPCVTDNPGWTWGYREGDCTKGTSRLHLILASKCLAQDCRSVRLDDNQDLWPRPDAPPLIADLDVDL